MEMYYRSRGINNFLEIRVGCGEEIAARGYAYQIRMIEENAVPYLLQPVSMEMDGILYLRYETNTQYVIDRMLQRSKMTGELLMNWMTQLLKCLEQAEKYLLSPDNLVLLPEYMFYSQTEGNIHLVYAPGYEKKILEQLRVLLEYFMQRFDAEDRDGIQSLYGFHAMVCKEGADLPELLQYTARNGMYGADIAGGKAEAYTQQTNLKLKETTMQRQEDVSKHEAAEQSNLRGSFHITVGRGIVMGILLLAAGYMLLGYFRGGGKAELYVGVLLIVIFGVHVIFCFGDTEEDVDAVMREYGQLTEHETGAAEHEYIAAEHEYIAAERTEPYGQGDIHRLVPLTNGALSEINLSEMGEACVVGRGKKETNYRLPTTQISRVHACIYYKQGMYYLEDRNSTNGTYINSVKIPPQQSRKLNKGDIVGFANEEFFVS